MQNETIAKAFEAAMETADCEALVVQIQGWFDTAYRTPENALGIIPCFASAVDTALTKKEDEARHAWRKDEAEQWRSLRQTIDAGIRRLVETVGKSAVVEPQHDRQTAGEWRQGATATKRDNWGRALVTASRPAIGGGWGRPPS